MFGGLGAIFGGRGLARIYQTIFTQGLDTDGVPVGSPVQRGPAGRGQGGIADVSATPGITPSLVIGSDVAMWVGRYEQR